MRGVFMAPFEKAVRVGRIGAIMPSHNETMGGVPSSANRWLLKDVLRDEWGFSGLTASDYFAVPALGVSFPSAQSVTVDQNAGLLAFNSGVDMELPTPMAFSALVPAVKSGQVDPKALDAAVGRVLAAKFNAGLFDQPLIDSKLASGGSGAKIRTELARKAADEAIVLLKNDHNLLPFDSARIKTLAVIGPNADKVRLGSYSGNPSYFVTVLDGIRRRAGAGTKVNYAQGCAISEPDASPSQNKKTPYKAPSPQQDAALIAQAIETARSADAIVLVLGGNETVSRESFGNLMGPLPILGDSDNLELPGRQNELVSEILKLGKPVIAVLLNGRPYSIEMLSQAVPAILEGWYLGQETGNAIAGVLFGDVNPSGRLPVTIARNAGQLPVYYNHSPQARLGYIFNDSTPLYPFGFGLSYTQFTFDKPTLDRNSISVSGTARVSVNVTNSGNRVGEEVVQMYVHPKVSSVVQPVMRLAGFQRVHLKPGQTTPVSFEIGPEQLAIWDINMKHTVEPGKVDVMVGANTVSTATVTLEVVSGGRP
jgi:beta-glucosidase